jgi:acyl-CoA dehydrogenase
MSDIRNDLLDTVDRICEEHGTRAVLDAAEEGRWPAALWQALDEVGLVRALLPEEAGGSGIAFDDAMATLRRCAYHALPLPLAETLLAGRLLLAAGLDVPQGALTVVPPGAEPLRVRDVGGQATVSGTARRVPWGDACAHAVLVGDVDGADWIGLVATSGCVGTVDRNLAGEPRATLTFEAQRLLAAAPLPGGRERLRAEGALVRSVQMAGAIERILSHSLLYASERVQFGKPIGKFQAVQHMLALLAGHAAAASAVTDMAVEASATQAHEFAVAVAKARTGEAAGKGAEIAHQVHGAMGFTHEHSLHQSTRRLWSWREEFGNESFWQERIGRTVAERGADALWPMITSLEENR